jgi:hypothetical protein
VTSPPPCLATLLRMRCNTRHHHVIVRIPDLLVLCAITSPTRQTRQKRASWTAPDNMEPHGTGMTRWCGYGRWTCHACSVDSRSVSPWDFDGRDGQVLECEKL